MGLSRVAHRSRPNPLSYSAAVPGPGPRIKGAGPPLPAGTRGPNALTEDGGRPSLRARNVRAGAIARARVPVPLAAPVAVSTAAGSPRTGARAAAEAEPEAEEPGLAGADALLESVRLGLRD